MGFFSSSDESLAKQVQAAEYRTISGQTPLSWLPGFLKRGFTDSAGKPVEGQVINHVRGLQTGILMGFGGAAGGQGRWGLTLTFAAMALGIEAYHHYRGKHLLAAAPRNEPN